MGIEPTPDAATGAGVNQWLTSLRSAVPFVIGAHAVPGEPLTISASSLCAVDGATLAPITRT